MEFIKTKTILSKEKYREYGCDVIDYLDDLFVQKKLEDFYSDEDFSIKFDHIMSHDKDRSAYYFHGTQCLEDASSILKSGLFMMREGLDTTSYRELTKDQVIINERGFGGEVGHEAYVIIDVPKDENGNEINVVTECNKMANITPSGLQGFDGDFKYMVPTDNIVGYVDKINKDVVYNANYKYYDELTSNLGR